MSVHALQEYEFERQFNEDEAIRWMQENWYVLMNKSEIKYGWC